MAPVGRGRDAGPNRVRETVVSSRTCQGRMSRRSMKEWSETADGAVEASFGYLNRNYEEIVDIPVGPNNRIEPGPVGQERRGQSPAGSRPRDGVSCR